jgi:hypothetical protein
MSWPVLTRPCNQREKVARSSEQTVGFGGSRIRSWKLRAGNGRAGGRGCRVVGDPFWRTATASNRPPRWVTRRRRRLVPWRRWFSATAARARLRLPDDSLPIFEREALAHLIRDLLGFGWQRVASSHLTRTRGHSEGMRVPRPPRDAAGQTSWDALLVESRSINQSAKAKNALVRC